MDKWIGQRLLWRHWRSSARWLGHFLRIAKTTAVLDIRIQSLEEKVNKHNQVVERMVIQEQSLKSVWRQIDEIKGEIKHEIIN